MAAQHPVSSLAHSELMRGNTMGYRDAEGSNEWLATWRSSAGVFLVASPHKRFSSRVTQSHEQQGQS